MSQFDEKAAEWDDDPKRVKIARDAAAAIVDAVTLTPQMAALEVGCGTGLAAMQLAGEVGSIAAVDTSEGMLDVLRRKVSDGDYPNIMPVLADLTHETGVAGPFDLIYSIMTFHHVREIETLLTRLYERLNPGGCLAIIDLDAEDGGFHRPGTEYEHDGFDRQSLKIKLENAGFKQCSDNIIFSIHRETETGPREFPVFLMTAQK